MEEKKIEIIPKGKIVTVEFPTDIVGSLRTTLEAERKLRSNLSDEQFSELVVNLCKFENDCDIKDHAFKMILYFVARIETQCKEDGVHQKVTKEEYQEMIKEATPKP